MSKEVIGLFKSSNKAPSDLEQLGIESPELNIFYARTFESIKQLREAVQFHNHRFPNDIVQIKKILTVENQEGKKNE